MKVAAIAEMTGRDSRTVDALLSRAEGFVLPEIRASVASILLLSNLPKVLAEEKDPGLRLELQYRAIHLCRTEGDLRKVAPLIPSGSDPEVYLVKKANELC